MAPAHRFDDFRPRGEDDRTTSASGAHVIAMPRRTVDHSAAPHLGRLLRGTYRILSVIDEGGMGLVLEAEQIRLRRAVAIKWLPQRLSRHSEALARFLREVEILSRVDHPHVVQVIDFDITPEGEPYLVMERLRGESLAACLRRAGALSASETARIVAETASGLAAVHAAGIVHRDLKPANVFLVSAEGTPTFVKLLDFGISKAVVEAGRRLTLGSMVLGTPDYMSPEQASGRSHSATAQSDQFSLASVAQEMLTGLPPFFADTVVEVMRRVREEEPTPASRIRPELEPEVDAVLARALRKDPCQRFPSVLEFSSALQRALEPPRTHAPPPESRGGQAASSDRDPVQSYGRVFARATGRSIANLPLTPTLVFVLSRLEDGSGLVSEVIDSSGLPAATVRKSLSQLAELSLIEMSTA